MPIEWVFPGATQAQKRQALDAALEVFSAHRIQPEVAGVARMEMQVFMSRNERGPQPHPEAAKAALIFVEAQEAAIAACGAPLGALDRGHIKVDVADDTFAGQYLRESEVLNWVDPDEAGKAAS